LALLPIKFTNIIFDSGIQTIKPKVIKKQKRTKVLNQSYLHTNVTMY